MTDVRENNGVLAGAERRALVWMADRMPRRVNSDHLTAVAAGGMVLTSAAFWAAGQMPHAVWVVIAGLAINWFGDSLDGTLARVRNQQRPRYGYYVDHVLDSAGMLLLFAGMALGGYLTPVVALATLVAYYFLSIEVYLATHALGTFRMAFWKIGPTELRIVIAAGALAATFMDPHVVQFGVPLRPFDAGAVAGSAALLLTAVRSAIVNARTLYRAEPLPPESSAPLPPPRLVSS